MSAHISKELKIRKAELQHDSVETIYFGGGTPSIMSIKDLSYMIKTIQRHYHLDSDVEITLEANPEDITANRLCAWYSLGINRLSVGLQSFLDKDLSFMNRAHDAQMSRKSLDLIKASKITNISADLMFGLIGSTTKEWLYNLDTITAYDLTHLSIYNLTIEEQTTFSHLRKEGKLQEEDESNQEEQFYLADQYLTSRGYEHYEISNYAKPGYRSRHNTNYWERVPYLGVGPAAHSLIGNMRSWNIANNNLYLKSDHTMRESEYLSDMDIYNEQIMLGLRRKEGFALHHPYETDDTIDRYLSEDILIAEDSRIRLAPAYWYQSDHIASDLFVTS